MDDEQTTAATDKTYTVDSIASFFNSTGITLKIYLPLDTTQNPYQYIVYDASQLVNGVQQNALFIYMRKTTDSGADLSGYDNDITISALNVPYTSITKLTAHSGFSPFDPKAAKAIVTIYHDPSNTVAYKQNCANNFFAQVPSMASSVAANGNFQCTLQLVGTNPRKGGTSWIPKT